VEARAPSVAAEDRIRQFFINVFACGIFKDWELGQITINIHECGLITLGTCSFKMW
jgi:hypothetical protein